MPGEPGVRLELGLLAALYCSGNPFQPSPPGPNVVCVPSGSVNQNTACAGNGIPANCFGARPGPRRPMNVIAARPSGTWSCYRMIL